MGQYGVIGQLIGLIDFEKALLNIYDLKADRTPLDAALNWEEQQECLELCIVLKGFEKFQTVRDEEVVMYRQKKWSPQIAEVHDGTEVAENETGTYTDMARMNWGW